MKQDTGSSNVSVEELMGSRLEYSLSLINRSGDDRSEL